MHSNRQGPSKVFAVFLVDQSSPLLVQGPSLFVEHEVGKGVLDGVPLGACRLLSSSDQPLLLFLHFWQVITQYIKNYC